jgi:hypothetical protein
MNIKKQRVFLEPDSEFNPDDNEPSYDFFCADKDNSTDFYRYETQMPECGSSNSRAGLTTTCCNTTDCNQIQIPAVVNRCYTGGTYTDVKTNANKTFPIASLECKSPMNKYCTVR